MPAAGSVNRWKIFASSLSRAAFRFKKRTSGTVSNLQLRGDSISRWARHYFSYLKLFFCICSAGRGRLKSNMTALSVLVLSYTRAIKFHGNRWVISPVAVFMVIDKKKLCFHLVALNIDQIKCKQMRWTHFVHFFTCCFRWIPAVLFRIPIVPLSTRSYQLTILVLVGTRVSR